MGGRERDGEWWKKSGVERREGKAKRTRDRGEQVTARKEAWNDSRGSKVGRERERDEGKREGMW